MSSTNGLRPITDADIATVLALNEAHQAATSKLDEAELRQLLAAAFRASFVEAGPAFSIALDENAQAESPNFQWFARRFPRFVYMDRIVVAASAARRGLGRLLYADLITAARSAGHAVLCCEVNVEPPNPGSMAFHEGMGFHEMAVVAQPERGKIVRYLSLDLTAP
jgi:predicted GNAT superfamily acetyltransferase